MERRSTHESEESKDYLLTPPETRVALRIIAFLSLVSLVVVYQLQADSVVLGLFASGSMLVLSGLGQADSKLTRPFSFLLAAFFPVVFGFTIVINGTVPFPFGIFGAALGMVLVKKQYSPYLAVAILTPPFAYVVVYPEALTPLVSRVLLVTPTLAFAFYFLLTRVYRRSHELSELVDQLESANHEKQKIVERQKEMFAVIGHELRTPVASMAMMAKDSDTSDSSARQHMESISNNLLSVLEDLRVVVAPERALESKLEVGHPTNKVERAISPLKPMIEESGFSISLVLPAKDEKHFHLHAQPLRQLVTNLVKNAVVHSGGDKVRVELTLNEVDETQTQATLRICDNGKGLTEAEQQHVFEAFGRGDTSSDGSGLGLFIVSQLVKKMDGSLSYETSELDGACFVVSFPMQVAEQQEQEQEQEQAQDILAGLNILLAEDDSFLAQLTQKLLSAKGAHVTVAENGRIALDAFQTHVMTQAFDVVITDLMMPELDGHGLVKAIRESDTQVPVIAVTAAVIGQETDQLMAEGATAVLSKPIKVDELAEVLNNRQTQTA